jgi:hypothetical protein
VVWWDLANFLYMLEERDEARPSDCAGCGVPVLNIMNGMHRDKLLGLIDGRKVCTDRLRKLHTGAKSWTRCEHQKGGDGWWKHARPGG